MVDKSLINAFAVLAAAGFFTLQGDLSAAAEYGERVYLEQTGEQRETFYYSLSRLGDRVRITSREEKKSFESVCGKNGETFSWEYRTTGEDRINARLDGDTLHLSGSAGGKVIDKSLSLEGKPWHQPLSYSLSSLLGDDAQETTFWMIRPDNLELVDLTARLDGCVMKKFRQQEVEACRVEVRKAGPLSLFWSASYWFRKADGVFMLYEGVHGPPGTTRTTVTLIEESRVVAQ